jgi:hypothetical protein
VLTVCSIAYLVLIPISWRAFERKKASEARKAAEGATQAAPLPPG